MVYQINPLYLISAYANCGYQVNYLAANIVWRKTLFAIRCILIHWRKKSLSFLWSHYMPCGGSKVENYCTYASCIRDPVKELCWVIRNSVTHPGTFPMVRGKKEHQEDALKNFFTYTKCWKHCCVFQCEFAKIRPQHAAELQPWTSPNLKVNEHFWLLFRLMYKSG